MIITKTHSFISPFQNVKLTKTLLYKAFERGRDRVRVHVQLTFILTHIQTVQEAKQVMWRCVYQ